MNQRENNKKSAGKKKISNGDSEKGTELDLSSVQGRRK